MKWFVLDINPEPWAMGPVVVGRKNGRYTGNVGQNQQLAAYKEAVRDEIGHLQPLMVGKVKLQFLFWRNRADYQTARERSHRKHEADATNLQKALEDALQSILFVNDRDVNDIQSVLVEQGPDVHGRIAIGIEESPELPHAAAALPKEVLLLLETMDANSTDKRQESRNRLDWGTDNVF